MAFQEEDGIKSSRDDGVEAFGRIARAFHCG